MLARRIPINFGRQAGLCRSGKKSKKSELELWQVACQLLGCEDKAKMSGQLAPAASPSLSAGRLATVPGFQGRREASH